VVTNASGTTYGPDRAFYSAPPDLPQIGGIAASEITTTGATLSSQIIPGNGDTVYTAEYGIEPSYGSATPISGSIGDDGVAHPVSVSLTGLTPDTTYHFRVVAINFGGTSHSPDQTFRTAALPGLPITPVETGSQGTSSSQAPPSTGRPRVRCRKGFVKRHGRCVRRRKRHHRGHRHHG
jgi:phosphodiesterase/alkaline phosphatase D-like protein